MTLNWVFLNYILWNETKMFAKYVEEQFSYPLEYRKT